MGNFNRDFKVPFGYAIWQKTNGSVSSSMTNGLGSIGTEIKSGSNLPSYKDRILKGVDATTPYQRSGFKHSQGYYSMKSHYNSAPLTVESHVRQLLSGPLPVAPPLTNATLIQNASMRLKQKLRDFTGQSNQLTNILELKDLRKSFRTVRESANDMLNVLQDSKKRGVELQKFAANHWLNWSFGIKPTLAAADDAVSSVLDHLGRGDHNIKDYGVSSEDWYTSTTSTISGSYLYNVVCNGRFYCTRSVKIIGGFRIHLRSSEDYTVGKHLGFDIGNVVLSAYELVPYSWLVDYFTTAGDFLEDVFSTDATNSVYIVQCQKLNVKGHVTFKPMPTSLVSNLDYFSMRPTAHEYFSFSRSPLSSLPRAPLRLKTADEVSKNATNKLLNLVGLLATKDSLIFKDPRGPRRLNI